MAKALKALEAAEGVIFRTKLNERGETAVVFPNKRSNATTLEVGMHHMWYATHVLTNHVYMRVVYTT